MRVLVKKKNPLLQQKRGTVENEISNNHIMATWSLMMLRRGRGASQPSSVASKFSARDQFSVLDVKDVHNIRRKEGMGKP